MNFKNKFSTIIFLILVTISIGVMQVLTPILLRVFVDGVLPSKDWQAIITVIGFFGINEILLLFTNGVFNRELDRLELIRVIGLSDWMVDKGLSTGKKLKTPEAFYSFLSQDLKRLAYRQVKNPWYRAKDVIVLTLLSLICLNISYLAGGLILGLAVVIFLTTAIFKDRQGDRAKSYYRLNDELSTQFSQLIHEKSSIVESENKIKSFKNLTKRVLYAHAAMAADRTVQNDASNVVRFVTMFGIITVGGHLISTGGLSMGSLWALLITMYRVSPPMQSLTKWLLQKNSEEGMEDRLIESMAVEEVFKKPAYYNRLTKIIEKVLKNRKSQVVILPEGVTLEEIKDVVTQWKSYYSQREKVVVLEKAPMDVLNDHLYFLLGQTTQLPSDGVVAFIPKNNLDQLKPSDLAVVQLDS